MDRSTFDPIRSQDAFVAAVLGGREPTSAAAFLAEILYQPDPTDTAAFAAAILGDHSPADGVELAAGTLREWNFDPDQPRDERGRWTTGGSDGDGKGEVGRAKGGPGPSSPGPASGATDRLQNEKNGASATPWPALAPYDADKKTGGASYLDWFKQFAGHASLPASQAEALQKAFLQTLKKGCIGVAAVGAGYSDIDDFRRQLSDCYWSRARAEDALTGKKCEGARDVYGQKPCPTLVAIQFSPFHWTNPVPRNPNAPGWWARWEQKDFGAQPVDLSKEANWNAVDHGIEVVPTPRGNVPVNIKGAFDVQFYSPRIGHWLGANYGVTTKTPDMRVFSLSDPQLSGHISKGDEKGYTMHLWCVVPEKGYESR
jgi:hypothetical protein